MHLRFEALQQETANLGKRKLNRAQVWGVRRTTNSDGVPISECVSAASQFRRTAGL